MSAMADLCMFLLLCSSLGLLGFISAEPDYCKRGAKVSEAYQHCFEEAHFKHPYMPLYEPRDIFDGCFLEAYANHTCSIVKPDALSCFRKNVTFCNQRQRLFSIADESGGACYGNHVNRLFKENVLNYLQPVRADSKCFELADDAYQCYSKAAYEMVRDNPNLQTLSIDGFKPVANRFFDTIYNCFVDVYKANLSLCENWQIPLLLEVQGTALPSLFGMTFTAAQMRRLELHGECAVHQLFGMQPPKRICYNEADHGRGSSNNNNNNNYPSSSSSEEDIYQQQQHHKLQQQQKKKKDKKQKKKKDRKQKKKKNKKKKKKPRKGRPSRFLKRMLEKRRKRNLFY